MSGSSMIWMGRQSGGAWDGGVAEETGWVEDTEGAKVLWDKRSSLSGDVKDTKHCNTCILTNLQPPSCNLLPCNFLFSVINLFTNTLLILYYSRILAIVYS